MATIQPVPDINPALPAFPGPNIPESQYDDQAYEWGSAIPAYGGRMKALGDNVHNNAQAAAGILGLVNDAQRLTELARDAVMGVTNFKGDWNTLSGSLARPATVQYNNSIWLLMRDVGNVAAEQPGVSSAWFNQTARVNSVMGRTGDVTGLVESSPGAARNKTQLMANAPVGQWVAYESLTGAGADWPTTASTAWWNVLTLGGTDTQGNVRLTQHAVQAFTQGLQSDMLVRARHDNVWGPWRRILTDGSVIEKWQMATIAGGACTVDPSIATVWWVEASANVAITVAPPRATGDQIVLRLVQRGSFGFSFVSNVKLPKGIPDLKIANGECLTLTLIPEFGSSPMWNAFVGAKHSV